MKYNHINQITADEIKSLIENKVQENSHLEYKREINFLNDADKKEVLADVCSFANSGGGIIIYGVEDKEDDGGKNTGIPKQITGLEINDDETKIQLEESIRKGIEPVLIGFSSVSREIDGKQILVLFIPKSSISPHRVSFKGSNKFYKRGGANKYEIPIDELRNDFLSGSELSKKISEFRSERVTKILSDDTPVPLIDGPKLVLHIIPLSFFDKNDSVDISDLNESESSNFSIIRNHRNPCKKLNFDGLAYFDSVEVCSYHSSKWTNYTYTQIFRNSVIEEVVGRDNGYISRVSVFSMNGKGYIYPSSYERKIIEALKTPSQFLIKKEFDGLCVIFLSLLNVKGYEVFNGGNQGIDRNILLLPEIYIENINSFSPDVMKPAFDMVWNAGNSPGSENYDENGKWIQK